MKKILKVSLVAMLVASPMVASAGVQYVTDNGMSDTNSGVSASTEIASVSFVQGAYNAAAAGINAEESRAKGVEGDLENLTVTFGQDETANLVNAINKVQANVAAVGSTGAESANFTKNAANTNSASIGDAGTIGGAINNVATATDTNTANIGTISGFETAMGSGVDTVGEAVLNLDGRVDTLENTVGSESLTGFTSGTADSVTEAVNTNRSDINILRGDSNTAGSVAKAQADAEAAAATDATNKADAAEAAAKAYVDQKLVQVRTVWGASTIDNSDALVNTPAAPEQPVEG